MARAKREGKKVSPYVKYNKSPYVYAFKNCKHKTNIYQSTPSWSGKVCIICNVIVGIPDTGHR